jgi:hypothetical protein
MTRSSATTRPSVTARPAEAGTPDALGDINDHHHHRQVLESEQAGGVDMAGGTETLDAAEHRRAGETGPVRPVHDLAVEGTPMPRVAFTDEDAQS